MMLCKIRFDKWAKKQAKSRASIALFISRLHHRLPQSLKNQER